MKKKTLDLYRQQEFEVLLHLEESEYRWLELVNDYDVDILYRARRR